MDLAIRRRPRFHSRAHEDEIDEKIQLRLSACGVQNHIQAKYEAALARVAQSQDQTKAPFHVFNTMPKLYRDTRAWKQAFSIIFAYLSELQMSATLDTLQSEAYGHPFPADNEVLETSKASNFVALLVARALESPSRVVGFRQSVVDFNVSPNEDSLGEEEVVRRLVPAGSEMIDFEPLSSEPDYL
jgi:hypothetical protein